ncbi:hypothetical protein DICPUDRAFT_23634, partial [Dictyostelium purpureum]
LENEEKRRRQVKLSIILFVTGFLLVVPWLVNLKFLRSSNRGPKILAIFSLVLFILYVITLTPFIVVSFLFIF